MDGQEIQLQLNELKKNTFYQLLNLAERVYILVKYSENVKVGTRGFQQEEKEHGLVLVLNTKMHFTWDEYGLSTKLAFGNSVQKCFIPSDDIIAVYSPELNSQLVIGPQPLAKPDTKKKGRKNIKKASPPEEVLADKEENKKSKVVKVDFQKKRK